MSSHKDDLFDSVVFFEENCQKQGYQDGFNDGRLKGWNDGYGTGWTQGKQIGNEIGYYEGFVQTWLACLRNKETKVKSKLEALSELLDQDWNDTARDLVTELATVRAKFKQVCSMLNLNVKHVAKNDPRHLSF